MPKQKKPKPNQWPTIPPFHDPQNYTWINSKEGGFWRRKRGTLTQVTLNGSFARNADNTPLTNAAAKRMVLRLQSFLTGLETGRITARFAGMLKKALNKNNRIDFSFFRQFEVQKEYPLEDLAPRLCTIFINKNEATIQIPIHKRTVVPPKRGATAYYFEAIWLYGDPTREKELRVDAVTSALYQLGSPVETTCKLVVPIPDKRPCMIFLKVNCLQGNGLATDPAFYGMQVIYAL